MPNVKAQKGRWLVHRNFFETFRPIGPHLFATTSVGILLNPATVGDPLTEQVNVVAFQCTAGGFRFVRCNTALAIASSTTGFLITAPSDIIVLPLCEGFEQVSIFATVASSVVDYQYGRIGN
jgi:hypothetical protein